MSRPVSSSRPERIASGDVTSRRRHRVLSVETRKGWPVAIEWNGRREAVRDIIDVWVVEGEWWHASRRRVYFRLRTDRRVIDVYTTDRAWMPGRVWD